jgi:hypothetical protein
MPEIFMNMKLFVENKVEPFYQEAKQILTHLLYSHGIEYDPILLEEALIVNQSLYKLNMKQQNPGLHFPTVETNDSFSISYNVLEFYQGILTSDPIPLGQVR